MRNRLSSPRNLSLFFALWILLATAVACGGQMPSAEPSATAVPVSMDASSTPQPAGTALPATPTSEFLIPVTGGGDEAAPALPEFRRLKLEYPPVIKIGSGSDVIILTLDVDKQGNITPTAQIEGNVVEGDVVEIPNLYATHNVTAEAYYEVAGLEVVPPGPTFHPLKQGERVSFTWSVRAQDVGTYGGTIFLFLNFENRETGEKDRKEISIQIFDIKAVDFFGFSTNFVKTSGVVGSALGVVVGFPFFKDIAKYLFDRLTKNKKKATKPKKKT